MRSFPFMELPEVARRRVFEILLVQREHVDSLKSCAGVVRVIEMPAKRFKTPWQRTFYLYLQGGAGDGRVLPRPDCPQADTYGSEPGYGGQLLRVSKTFYREAAPIFYGLNLFVFESARAFLPFLIDRTHLSRQHLAAVSLPWPHKSTNDDTNGRAPGRAASRRRIEQPAAGPRTFGRVFDWQGAPRFVQEVECTPLWPWLCENIFNQAAKNLPALKIVDLRAQAYRYEKAHSEAPRKRYRWQLAHGYRIGHYRQLAMLNFLTNLDLVRISNPVFVRPVHRLSPTRWQIDPSREAGPAGVPLRAIDEYRAEAFNQP